jgi:hypothetical protein
MFNDKVDYTFNYWDENLRYMAQKGHDDNGRGDGLYRTSLAYIAYGNAKLKSSILSSFREFTMINKRHRKLVQGARAPFRHSEDDFSRDQYILAVSALYIKGDSDELVNITSKIPYRLSRRFRMTPTLWCWTKYLQGKNKKFNLVLYRTLELLSQLFIIPISKLGQLITGLNKHYSITELLSVDPNLPYWHYDNTKKEWIYKTEPSKTATLSHKLCNKHLMMKDTRWWYKLAYGLITPGYANSLGAYMAHIAAGKLLKRLLLTNIPKANILQRYLLDDKSLDIKTEILKDYHDCTGYIWNSNFLGTSIKYKLSKRETEYNNVPLDIIKAFTDAKEE